MPSQEVQASFFCVVTTFYLSLVTPTVDSTERTRLVIAMISDKRH